MITYFWRVLKHILLLGQNCKQSSKIHNFSPPKYTTFRQATAQDFATGNTQYFANVLHNFSPSNCAITWRLAGQALKA